MREFGRVGVVGCGLMGSGIAEVCARAGLDVLVAERGEEALAAGRSRVTASLDRGLRSGKLSADEREAALARLEFTTDLDEFADRDLVVEAVAEQPDVKIAVFKELDRVLRAGTRSSPPTPPPSRSSTSPRSPHAPSRSSASTSSTPYPYSASSRSFRRSSPRRASPTR